MIGTQAEEESGPRVDALEKVRERGHSFPGSAVRVDVDLQCNATQLNIPRARSQLSMTGWLRSSSAAARRSIVPEAFAALRISITPPSRQAA